MTILPEKLNTISGIDQLEGASAVPPERSKAVYLRTINSLLRSFPPWRCWRRPGG